MTDKDSFNDKEAARRRDEVVRRMANTPPQPKPKTLRPLKKAKKAVPSHGAGKSRATHGA